LDFEKALKVRENNIVKQFFKCVNFHVAVFRFLEVLNADFHRVDKSQNKILILHDPFNLRFSIINILSTKFLKNNQELFIKGQIWNNKKFFDFLNRRNNLST